MQRFTETQLAQIGMWAVAGIRAQDWIYLEEDAITLAKSEEILYGDPTEDEAVEALMSLTDMVGLCRAGE